MKKREKEGKNFTVTVFLVLGLPIIKKYDNEKGL